MINKIFLSTNYLYWIDITQHTNHYNFVGLDEHLQKINETFNTREQTIWVFDIFYSKTWHNFFNNISFFIFTEEPVKASSRSYIIIKT